MTLSAEWEMMLKKAVEDCKRNARYYYPGPKDTVYIVLDRGEITVRSPEKPNNSERDLRNTLVTRLTELTNKRARVSLLDVEGEGILRAYTF